MEGIDAKQEILKVHESVRALFEKHNIPPAGDHGISHIDQVLKHTQMALDELNIIQLEPDDEKWRDIQIAAICHDNDDSKLFKVDPGDHNHNTRIILSELGFPQRRIEGICAMIDIVSCSHNGNRIPIWAGVEHLIPRYADRCEATGLRGIERCIQYNVAKGRPLYTSKTPRVYSIEDIKHIAIPERFWNYQTSFGASDSVVDHCYDKLLHLNVDTGVSYLNKLLQAGHDEIVGWVLTFWRELEEKEGGNGGKRGGNGGKRGGNGGKRGGNGGKEGEMEEKEGEMEEKEGEMEEKEGEMEKNKKD